MRTTKLVLIVIIGVTLVLSSCTRQALPNSELEPLASWITLGDKLNGSIESMAFNTAGEPIVATTIPGPGLISNRSVYVRQWLNGQWRLLGKHLDIQLSQDVYYPDITVDRLGRPVVAWSERSDVYVKRWDGQNWVPLGEKLDIDPARGFAALFPKVAIDGQNRPVVVWQEVKQDGLGNYNLYVKRWEDDSGWVQVGSALDINLNKTVFMPSIVIDNSDRIYVAWSEAAEVPLGPQDYNIYVKRWDGSKWVSLAGTIDFNIARYASYPSLALDGKGKLYVAWLEATVQPSFNVTAKHIYVKRFDGNNTWTSLGGAINSGLGADIPKLVAYGENTLMVSFTSWSPGSLPDPTNAYVKSWKGSQWIGIGAQPVVVEGGSIDLGISPSGLPTLAYSYSPRDPEQQLVRGTYIKRYQ
jgi:hypothetical protein